MKYLQKIREKYKLKKEEAKYRKIKKQIVGWAMNGKILEASNSIEEIKKKKEGLNDIYCRLGILGFDLADSANTTLYTLKLIENGDLNSVKKARESLGNMFVTMILLAESLGIDIDFLECLSDARNKFENEIAEGVQCCSSDRETDPERDSYIDSIMNNNYS